MDERAIENGGTKVCDKTKRKFLKNSGFTTCVSQHKNINGIKAESDPRNVLSACVAFQAITSGMKLIKYGIWMPLN